MQRSACLFEFFLGQEVVYRSSEYCPYYSGKIVDVENLLVKIIIFNIFRQRTKATIVFGFFTHQKEVLKKRSKSARRAHFCFQKFEKNLLFTFPTNFCQSGGRVNINGLCIFLPPPALLPVQQMSVKVRGGGN